MPSLRAACLAACLAAPAFAPALAHAGTYVSLGVGGTPTGQGDLALVAASGSSDTPQQRVSLGQSLGRLAVEGSLGRFGLGAGDAVAAGVHARLSIPLDGHLGAYGRLGLERVWLHDVDTAMGDSADGVAAGLGLEYRLSLPLLGQAGVWAEMSQDQLGLANDQEGGVRMWTIGATLGL